jgi:ribulose-5-phosphate 4-epimerase/fuculose-1-phosphate aldolase
MAGADKKIAILQNHGIVALGRLSIDEAAWW